MIDVVRLLGSDYPACLLAQRPYATNYSEHNFPAVPPPVRDQHNPASVTMDVDRYPECPCQSL
jgi:hypothetical protein